MSHPTPRIHQKVQDGRRYRQRAVHLVGPVCTCTAADCLKVGGGIGSAAGVVILLEVGLERRGVVLGLVAEGGARVGHEVGVVFGNAVLLAPHAPAHEGDASEKDGAANTADYTADDALALAAEAAAATAAAGLG